MYSESTSGINTDLSSSHDSSEFHEDEKSDLLSLDEQKVMLVNRLMMDFFLLFKSQSVYHVRGPDNDSSKQGDSTAHSILSSASRPSTSNAANNSRKKKSIEDSQGGAEQ
jgi:hypothetical protein